VKTNTIPSGRERRTFETPETLKECTEITAEYFAGKSADIPLYYLFGAIQFLAVTISHLREEIDVLKKNAHVPVDIDATVNKLIYKREAELAKQKAAPVAPTT